MEDLSDKSERELLLLLNQKVELAFPVIEKRLDAHARDIKDLRAWRFYQGGALAAVAAYFGIKTHGG